ncbi:hypothetical protein TWF506_005310 [Arthrobotrys conoides]|uniref:Uncharacterized protein n=1 Tax=Arthrobotrys conoides TaxID=74498 RepID=A0AAN8NBK9_9PEZI
MVWSERDKYNHQVADYDIQVALANREYKSIVDQVNHIPVKIRDLVLEMQSTVKGLEVVIDTDEYKMKARLANAIQPFHKLHEDAQNALTEAGDLHTKFKEFLAAVVLPLDLEIHKLERELGIVSDNQFGVVGSARDHESQEEKTLRDRKDKLGAERAKLQRLKKNRNKVCRAFIPFYAKAEDKNQEISETKIEQLEADVLEQQRNLDKARAQTAEEVEIWRDMGRTGREARRVGGLADSLIDQMSSFQSNFRGLKDSISKAILQVAHIEDTARDAVNYSLDKDDFLSGIIEICAAVLIDPRMEEPVTHIHARIREIYRGRLPFSDFELRKNLKKVKYVLRLEVGIQLAMRGNKSESRIVEGTSL